MSQDGGPREWTGSEPGYPALEALAQAHCYWDAFDAAERERVKRRGGRLDAAAVTRILGLYRAARSVGEEDRERLAVALNARAGDFRAASFAERAKIVLDVAKGLEGVKHPRSAITKLFWFLSPTGWTMYDSLGREALEIRSQGDAGFNAFYSRLEKRGFPDLAEQARDVLGRHHLPENLAERSIDFLLMTAGGRRNPSDGPEWVEAYLATRREGVAGALEAAAAKLAVPYFEFLQRVKTR